MTQKEYSKQVDELEKQLKEITAEYIDSNKIYNFNDYLKVTFPKNEYGDIVTEFCKIINIYPCPDLSFNPTGYPRWPKGHLVYFAKYAYKSKNNCVRCGTVCYLGPLSDSNIVCGYMGIEWDKVKIEVIDESEIPMR